MYAELGLAIVLGYWSGMRLGEIAGLEWGQIDLRRTLVSLREGETKNGQGRRVPLHPEAVKALGTFPTRKVNVFERTSQELSWQFRRLTKRLGIRDLRFHDLRHTAATRYRKAGVGLLTLQRIGGWKTLEMLKRYNTIDDDDLREAVRKITKG